VKSYPLQRHPFFFSNKQKRMKKLKKMHKKKKKNVFSFIFQTKKIPANLKNQKRNSSFKAKFEL